MTIRMVTTAKALQTPGPMYSDRERTAATEGLMGCRRPPARTSKHAKKAPRAKARKGPAGPRAAQLTPPTSHCEDRGSPGLLVAYNLSTGGPVDELYGTAPGDES
jgi:hypothetical protein